MNPKLGLPESEYDFQNKKIRTDVDQTKRKMMLVFIYTYGI